MAQKIEIPVSLNAQIDNLKQIRSTLINTVNAAGKESTLAKTLTKDLGKVDEQIRELESISLQPTINESEFRHIQTIFDRLTKQFQSSFTQIDLSGFEQIASEADINRLKSLTQEASKYRKELEAIQKAGSSEKTEAFLTRTNRQQLLDQGRTLKGFDSTATLDKNATAMGKAAESYRRSAIELQDALDTLDQEATDASNRARTIKDRVDNLTAQHQTLRTDSRIADFHYRAASLETNFSANSQMSNPTVGSIRTGLRRTLETVYADGKIATDAREAVSDWIKKLAPNISTTEAARMVQQDLTTLLEDLMEEIFGAGYRADNDLLYNPNHSAMLSRAQGYSRAEINRLNRKHSTATVADIGTRTKEVQQQLKQEQAEYQRINNEINKKQAKWDELDEQQSSYLNAANEASKLSQELYTLSAAEKAAAEAAKQAQIAQNEAEQEDLKNRVVSGVKGSAAPGPGQIQGLRGNLKGFEEDTGERYSGEKAAEEFKHNLQMSIRQWMSVQQIVNIIKDGLRQAFQDIQGLDKAMTNIAVVTDRSVDDLWGKINDYMSIAQRYGVTTQGVYEVSQLYYQQGLSTSEVMAATTETLKMARIAGMDYAEAADAMTVAIRAFKMEMSDAGHVTDVYSKVAAITASDSEELAIAMSKTASSAENVGSSFENTTAMLAVMIETTRESAQNLGSALKSIISRYGEMKQGLTQDSDGEIIDYNKTDAALRSIGISIKDAQGQFRDFDDVIFELSSKWDSLDKNTQRYIATIMAGNRQQSRFIALVDNWERLDEVASSAQDSEDAGLLQYAKTLDSLESKINNLKTSFQQFYMSIFNGEFFKGAVDIINNFVQSLSRVGPVLGTINLLQLISQIKLVGQLLINTFSKSISKMHNANKEWQNAFTGGWTPVGEKIANALATAILNKASVVGKEFVNRVKTEAENTVDTPAKGDQTPTPQQANSQPQLQPYSTKILGKASQVLHTWSPLTASALGQHGSVQDRVSILANTDPDKINEAYQKQADIILAAGDKFGDSAKKWAESVKAAGQKFGKDIDEAAKREGLKELNTADLEAQKELAAVEQEIAKRKAAEVKQQVGSGLMTVGVALSSAGMMTDQSTMEGYDLSTGLQAAGGALSAVGQFVTGNYAGALVTAVTSVITVFQRFNQRAEAELENAEKASEAANVERAQTKESYTNLQSLLKQYETAKANQYNDDESYQAWLDVNNQLVEAYPELLGYIDAEGNAIADVTSKTEILSYYMQKAAEASKEYYDAKIYETELALRNNQNKETNEVNRSWAGALTNLGITPSRQRSYSNHGISSTGYWYQVGDVIEGLENQNIDLNELLVDYNLNPDKYVAKGNNYSLPALLVKMGLFTKSGDSHVLSDSAREYYDAYHLQNELIGYRKGAATANLSLLLSNETLDDSFDDITGYESLLYTYALSLDGITNDVLRQLHSGSEEWKIIIEGYANLYSNFSSAQHDILNQLYNNLDEYSLSEIKNILSNDLNLTEDNDLYKAYIKQWYEKNYGQLSNWTNRYSNITGINYADQFTSDESSAFSEGLDIYSWIKRKAELNPEDVNKYTLDNLDNLYEEYYLELETALGENDPFFAFIKQNSDATIEAYLDYLANEKKTIDTRGEGYQVAQDRKSWMTGIIAASTDASSELGKILAENEEARNEFWAMIFTDVGTYDWANSVSAWGDKYNYTGFANAERYAYENYVVRLQTIIDSTSAAVKSLDELAKKQSSGFTWEESQKYLKQLQELDPSQSWHDLFEVNEQGLIVLKDFAQTADMLYLNSIKTLQQEAAKSQKIFETLRPQIEYNSREGKNFDPSMGMDTIFELTNSVLHGEGIDAASFTEATYAELEHLIATGEITNTFDLIEWYNNLPEEKRFAGILKQEKDWIEEAFERGGLTDNSEESYDRALELAQTINKAYRLNFDESSQEFQTLVSQIRAGQITSVETLLSFYQNIADQADTANDVFAKQARLLLANTSFTSWSESFIKGNSVKNLASITNGAYTDLQSLWVQRLEQDWQSIMGANQPKYEVGDQILENGEIITLGPQHTDKIGKIKTIDSWDSSDYAAYYDAQARALVEHGARLDAFGNLIITDWEKWASYIADSYGYTEEAAKADPAIKEARDQILVTARAAQMQLEESATKNIQTGLEGLYTSAIEDQELSWDSVSNIIQAANLDAKTQNEVLNAYEAAKRQGVTGYIAFIDYLTKIIQNGANGSELDITALNAAKRDAQNGLISSLVSSLNQGLEGTLTNANFNALIEQIGGAPEAYRKYVTETYDGLKLSAEGALVIASQLIDKFGNTSLVAESLVEQLGGSGALGSYKDVDDLINEIINDTNHWAHGNEDILNLLYRMRSEYSQLAEDARFDFMNQDHFNGAADNWYTFTDNMSTAIGKLKSAFEKGGKIDYKSFDNIITWIADLSVDGLDTKLGETGITLGKFTDAVLATVDATGNLDLSAAAAKLGISMDDMAGALEGGLQEVAKQQVAYWKKYLDFLKGLKKLQEAQDEVSLHIPIQNEVDGTWTYEGKTYESWEALVAAYGGNLGTDLTAAQQFFENFTYTGENGTTITLSGKNNPLNFILGELDAFEPDGTLKAGMEQKIGQYMGQVFAWINTLTEKDIDHYINKDTGEITIPWSEILQIELDTSTTPEVNTTNAGEAGEQTQEVAEKAAESALTASGATPNGDGSYSYTLDGMTLKIQMGANGAVEIDLTNATGTLPSALELRKVFEGQEGFTATDDNNWVFTDPNLGFSVKCSNGTISFDTSNMTAPAAPTAAELSAILGTAWTTTDGGKTYTTNLNGVSFVYNSATGKININASSFQLTGGLDATSLATILGGAWTTEDGIIYKSTINDVTFTYESTTGELVVTPPTIVTEPTNADFATLMQAQGWAHENGVYTKDFDGGTLTYNATAGTLNITPSATMAAVNPDMATLLDSAFGAGGWQPNKNGGYDILNATTGEVLYTLSAKVTITPTAGSNVTLGENGLTADLDVTLTPDTGAIDDALSAYEGKTINLTIGISKNSSIKFSQHFEKAAAALFGTSEWDTLLNTKNWSFLNGSNQDLAEEAFGSLVTQASVLSGANQLTQEDIDLITTLGEAMEEAGINVSAAMETLSSLTAIEDNTVLTDLTAFAEAFGGANLFGNLTALTALLTAMTNPAAVSLDLTGFTTQLQSMGELELDDEEINAFVAAITALTTAITALPTEVNVSVKVSAGNSYSVINNIKNALAGIKNKTVTVTTKHVNSGDDGGNNGDENPNAPTDANYAGNVSGLALARGNATDKLLAGAHLAGKTLVGELGPELAVYDNQYHLLGRDGAEFVDLPNDAIVFNHRQTAGIIKGQAGYRGQALVNGNVTGPAAAGGIDAAISSVEKIIKLWSNIADSSLSDLLSGGGGGGGSGNTIKAVTEELQEWYNLSRQIADIEQEINNLIAERQNIAEKNGDAYLRSLRKEQELLEQQAATQEILLGYQQLQLERQAEQINTNKIWSQFLEVNESGLLQYIKGNELNGGKGALEVLSELNEMSGEEQLKFLNNLGYTAVDQDGEKLEGQELIQKFFEELQLQIDEYDALYDTVHKTEETLEDLQHKVEEINNQIIENQMDLEEDIFNILVDAWEAEIEALEEQKDLIEEANEAYIKGLNEALSAEREMYSEEQSIADREQLQRQLSLLRRSGGSASQIADLEQQLDSMLKDEYFRNQEQVIERIEDANEEQIRQLERQIKLQEEALEFEKEHGILWTKVYDIMAGSADQILNFMQGNSPEFFSQSLLQQEKMLTDWAKKIGIYTENKKYEGYEQDIQQSAWDSGDIWSYGAMSGYKSTYDSMTAEQQAAARKMFNTTYANARLAGDDHNTAMAKAQNALINNFKSYKEQQAASGNKPETDLNTGSGSETWYVTGPNKLNLRDQPSKSGNRLAQLPAGTKVKVIKKLSNGWFQVEVDGKTGYVDSQFLSKGTSSSSSSGSSSSSSSSSNGSSSSSSSSSSGQQYKANYTITYQSQSTGDVRTYTGTGIGNTEAAAINAANAWLRRRQNGERPSAFPASEWDEMSARAATKAYAYAQGGLVDYTGIAMVHGSSSKPEAFLNAKQTAMISEAVKVAGDGGALDGIRTTLNKLDATIKSIVNNNKNETTSFTVAPGAVTIQVAQLNDSYDVEELSKDVMNRMVAIASKSTNRGVNRR